MKTRILIHYVSGMTWASDLDELVEFNKINHNNTPISSLQIQEADGTKHTLSSKKKRINTFYQRDLVKDNVIEIRSILRKLNKDMWLELSLNCISGKRTVTIIREDLEA